MNNRSQDKLKMFTNVDDVLTEKAALIDEVPALSALVKRFHDGLAPVAEIAEILELDSTGHRKAKANAKAAAAKIGASLCGVARSYANDTKNSVLFAQVNYSESELKGLADQEMKAKGKGKAIYGVLNNISTELVAYGVKSSQIADFKVSVDNFIKLCPSVRAVMVDRKTLRQQFLTKVAELNDLLRFNIDSGMNVMQLNEPDFYMLYKNVRRNYARGGRSKQSNSEETTQPEQVTDLSKVVQDMNMKTENGVAV